MPVFTTACPRNCTSTCSMQVTVEDGRICRIEIHPSNRATLGAVCLKGLSYIEREYASDRILTPLQKQAGTNNFKEISWENALGIIADKLLFFKEKYGPKSIFFYAGSGTKGLLNGISSSFWRLFGGCTRSYGDLCWQAGLEATRLTLGDNKHNAPWDIANSKLIILWGKNPAETNIHQMVFINQALDDGAKLVVIDPRRTESSERAFLLLQPRPGTDGCLALAIANILIEKKWYDTEFIKKYVKGFDEFQELARKYPLEKAEEITEIPVDFIFRLARYIGTIKPLTISCGFGMQRYTNSGQTIRAILALLAITGNVGKPGAGWVYANLQSHIFNKFKDPIASYPPEHPDENANERYTISVAKLGQDILNQTNPPLKMIWVERGNPVTSNPDTNTVLRAFRSLEFRVVVDQFMTDTAREADIILPAKSMFEQSDVINAYWHPYIQIKQKIMEPPAQVKPETEIYYLLAKKLGIPQEKINKHLPGLTDADINGYLTKRLAPFPELTLESLSKSPIIAPGHQEIAFSDYIFPTPSGKVELYSEEAQKRWGVSPLPEYTESVESVKQKLEQAIRYPLHLLTPNTKNRIHSQFNNLSMIRAISPKPILSLNIEDAKKRGIKNGDIVQIYNDRGALTIEAQIDFSIKSGCVSVTNGWWICDGGTVNFLSAGRETDIGYGAAFHDNLVEVEKTQ